MTKVQRKRKWWRDKLPKEVVEYLEVYRETRHFNEIPQGDLLKAIETFRMRFEAVSSGTVRKLPELPQNDTTVLVLDQRKFDLLRSMGDTSLVLGENLIAAGYAETLESVLFLADLMDDPKHRAGLCFGLALLYKYLKSVLEAENPAASAAKLFEFLAKLCRGRLELPKDGPNSELIAMVNLLRQHQKENLTPKDLHAAVHLAGLYRDDPEAFRVWLHLEQKKGRVVRTQEEVEIQIPLKKNGKIDWAAMPMQSRIMLLQLMRSPAFHEQLGLDS